MWTVTPDGSIEDASGRAIFFSPERFLDDICLGDCCFICGAKPGSKRFNNEHILPEWVLRRYDLFARTITPPNGVPVRYDRYTIPCCADCNTLMGRKIEIPISNAVHQGSEAFAEFIRTAGLNVIIWMGLIFLKTHLKDRKYRLNLDKRLGDDKIADLYEWEQLHHLHSIVRCFYTGCVVDKDSAGSFLGISVRGEGSPDKFDYGDLYQAQTMFMRLDDMGMVAVFNDCGAAMSWSHERYRKITGAVSAFQLREIMVDFGFLNLSLKERPTYEAESNLNADTCRTTGQRGGLALDEVDLRLRGRMMEYAFKDIVPHIHVRDATGAEFQEAIRAGTFSFLFDEHGNFIEKTITLPDRSPEPRKDADNAAVNEAKTIPQDEPTSNAEQKKTRRRAAGRGGVTGR